MLVKEFLGAKVMDIKKTIQKAMVDKVRRFYYVLSFEGL